MSPRLDHPNLGDVQKHIFLTAHIVSVDREEDTAEIMGVGKCPSRSAIPIYYHCKPDSQLRDNGALEGAAGAFAEFDEVIVMCEIISGGHYRSLRVMGFVDKPKSCISETVYVRMVKGSTTRCFVWEPTENKYAVIINNDGDPASFPCDPADISEWLASQTSIGDDLYLSSPCGVHSNEFFLTCPLGNWGTSGSNSDSKEEWSNCCDEFLDTGSCLTTWAFTSVCVWAPGAEPPLSSPSGPFSKFQTQHILWDAGGQAKACLYQNDSGDSGAFKVELQHTSAREEYSCEGWACNTACHNRRLDSGLDTKLYTFHTPLEDNLYEVASTRSRHWNGCGDSGGYDETDFLVEERLKDQGSYTNTIIAQIFTVEVRTLTRNRAGDIGDGDFCYGDCTWLSEVYTASDLNVSAQVGFFEMKEDGTHGTEGVNPSGLPTNSSFEASIKGTHDALRAAEGIPVDELVNAALSMVILRG